jgi:hypothetical protein
VFCVAVLGTTNQRTAVSLIGTTTHRQIGITTLVSVLSSHSLIKRMDVRPLLWEDNTETNVVIPICRCVAAPNSETAVRW